MQKSTICGMSPGVRAGRHLDAHHVQAVVEVLPEGLGLHDRLEVLVRRRDDAHVDPDRLRASDALDLALLQDAQDLGLGRQRHVADLVEEDRPAVAELELADPLARGAREGALLVAEELALDQVVGDGGAVDGDERLGGPVAVLPDRAGDQLLARAALARDHDRDVARRHLADDLEDLLHDRRRADDALLVVLGVDRRLVVADRPQVGVGLERVLGEGQSTRCGSKGFMT
jgi:hypothetical protein